MAPACHLRPVVHAYEEREPVGDAQPFQDPVQVLPGDGDTDGVVEDEASVFIDDGVRLTV